MCFQLSYCSFIYLFIYLFYDLVKNLWFIISNKEVCFHPCPLGCLFVSRIMPKLQNNFQGT